MKRNNFDFQGQFSVSKILMNIGFFEPLLSTFFRPLSEIVPNFCLFVYLLIRIGTEIAHEIQCKEVINLFLPNPKLHNPIDIK